MTRRRRSSRGAQAAQQVQICLLIVTAVVVLGGTPRAQDFIRDAAPALFTYQELVELGQSKELRPELAKKLHEIITTPFVSNEAYYAGARAAPLDIPRLGPSLRVALWNIERGLELDHIQMLFTDADGFVKTVTADRKQAKERGKRIRQVDIDKVHEQIELLKSAQVLILNEVDWGVKRTDYREVVRELAKTLNMNWAYGVEFVEVAPTQLGTDSFDYGETEEARQQLLEVFKVDKDRLRGSRNSSWIGSS